MIITRTPFRISFFGGGTDYPAYYEHNGGGAVLSASIDKFCYISSRYLPPFFKHKHKIVWSKLETVNDINKIKHHSARETLRYIGHEKGVEIHHDGDLPAMSGLGSSSAFTVGLIHALAGLKGQLKSKRELALNAIHIEQNMIKENIGSQDQVIVSFGGLNRINFGGPQKFEVHPIVIRQNRRDEFENHLMLFFTDFTRQASKIAKEWIKKTPQKYRELQTMKAMVNEATDIISNDSRNLEDFGKLLHENWLIKKNLNAKITNPKIDEIYDAGRKAGALGGKLLGAGGGGFMLFFARPSDQPKIKQKLKHLLHVSFKFDDLGSQMIYYGNEVN